MKHAVASDQAIQEAIKLQKNEKRRRSTVLNVMSDHIGKVNDGKLSPTTEIRDIPRRRSSVLRPMSAIHIGGDARRRLPEFHASEKYKFVEKKKRPSTAGTREMKSTSETPRKGSLTPTNSQDPSISQIKQAQLYRKMGPRTMARRHEKLVEHHAGGAISLLRGRDNVVLKHLSRGRNMEDGVSQSDTAKNLMAKAMSLQTLKE